MKLPGKQRREEIKTILYNSDQPISASTLAKQFQVSRQIIVGDIAILRASSYSIIATPKGYIYTKDNEKKQYIIACIHNDQDTYDELNTIVDCGGIIINVIVNHPVYGELIGNLNLHNRIEVKEFIDLCQQTQAKNLSHISDGIHLHTIEVNEEKHYHIIVEELRKKGYLYESLSEN